ncbi:MAG: gamma-glutamylcyclotransferase family protein [Rhizobiaceae bacterium]
MSNEANIAYFGYGSLVNLDTLRTPYISAHRARIKGWRRVWLQQPAVAGSLATIDGLAFLSVEPAPQTSIDGLIIIDHQASLKALDEREELYERVSLPQGSVSFEGASPVGTNTPLFLYQATHLRARSDAKILRSYLDAVMLGYLNQFGEEGVMRFMQTTMNFDCGILEDRKQPLYPRSVELSTGQMKMFSKLALPK